MTGRNMCEAIFRWLSDEQPELLEKRNIKKPMDIWNDDPNGELLNVFALWQDCPAKYRKGIQ